MAFESFVANIYTMPNGDDDDDEYPVNFTFGVQIVLIAEKGQMLGVI